MVALRLSCAVVLCLHAVPHSDTRYPEYIQCYRLLQSSYQPLIHWPVPTAAHTHRATGYGELGTSIVAAATIPLVGPA